MANYGSHELSFGETAEIIDECINSITALNDEGLVVNPHSPQIRVGKNTLLDSKKGSNLEAIQALCRYVGLKDKLLRALLLMQAQFAIMPSDGASSNNKISAITQGQKPNLAPKEATVSYDGAQSAGAFPNKIQSLCLGPMSVSFGSSFIPRVQGMIEENIKMKEKMQKDTRCILIEELLDPLKKKLKTEKLTQHEAMDALVKQNALLIDRLAVEMDARIAQNESSLENINIYNRPMNVAEEYNLLMSNAWLEAKAALDGKTGEGEKEEEKHRLLCEILTEAETQANLCHEESLKTLARQLKNPVKYHELQHQKQATSECPTPRPRSVGTSGEDILPPNVLICIGDYLRNNADFTNLDALIRKVGYSCETKTDSGRKAFKQLIGDTFVKDYIAQCVRISWKMVIQRPRMRFNTDGTDSKWNGNKDLELAWGSKPSVPGATIRYYKQPTLLHGSKRMVKGVVYVA